jgi:hypothetical protein
MQQSMSIETQSDGAQKHTLFDLKVASATWSKNL